jgi:hypothetical protein
LTREHLFTHQQYLNSYANSPLKRLILKAASIYCFSSEGESYQYKDEILKARCHGNIPATFVLDKTLTRMKHQGGAYDGMGTVKHVDNGIYL